MILTTTPLPARLGISERTTQRSIAAGTIQVKAVERNRYEVSEDELRRLAAEREGEEDE